MQKESWEVDVIFSAQKRKRMGAPLDRAPLGAANARYC